MGECKIDLGVIMQILSIASGVVLIAVAVLCFMGCSFFNDENGVRLLVITTYQCLFGIIIVLGELGLPAVLDTFRFMALPLGKAFFYIFVGVFAIGDEAWYNIAAGLIFFLKKPLFPIRMLSYLTFICSYIYKNIK